ncbi:MAG: YlxR family protein [Deltaproteobacteria bacterium]|nr:YlxR family protein [Deltaproteobacteria bacterium]
MSDPIRTCVGCGAKRPQAVLLRFERTTEGDVRLSLRRSNGRGAYLCPNAACFRKAWKKRSLQRKLGDIALPKMADFMAERVQGILERRRATLLVSAPKSLAQKRISSALKALKMTSTPAQRALN